MVTHTGTQTQPHGPALLRERALAPDLARGVMLAFIALANSVLYLYGREYGIRQHIVDGGNSADRAVSALLVVFVDGRAYPLFAALFGYGMVQIVRRQTGAGLAWPQTRKLLRRRSWWLVAFGFVHALLLFSGDILGTYGLLGLLLVGLLHARDRVLLVVAALWLVPTGLLAGMINGIPSPDPSERTYLWSMAIGDPLAAMVLRPVEWLMTPFAMVGVLSAALVGVWAARRRVLDDPAGHRSRLRLTAVIGIGVAAAGGVPTALVMGEVWQPPVPVLILISGIHAVTGVAGGLGYAALLGLVAVRVGERPGPVVRALAACGQRSLTFYLAQSVVFVALLAAYAGGLGGRLGTAGVAVVALLTWGGTVVAAALMARAGWRGPAEVLLRRLVYRGR